MRAKRGGTAGVSSSSHDRCAALRPVTDVPDERPQRGDPPRCTPSSQPDDRACRPARRCRRSSATCSNTGPATRRSRRASTPVTPGLNGRERVRLLRRAAVRQRAAALWPPADRLREGPGAAVSDDARSPCRAPIRLGLPRSARRGRGREAARHHDEGRDPRAGHGEVQRGLPQSRCCDTPRNGSGTSPARRAGSTSRTTTRHSTRTTWKASCGRSSRFTTRAWCTRASACSRTAGAVRRRCRTPRPGWTTSTRTGRIRR